VNEKNDNLIFLKGTGFKYINFKFKNNFYLFICYESEAEKKETKLQGSATFTCNDKD